MKMFIVDITLLVVFTLLIASSYYGKLNNERVVMKNKLYHSLIQHNVGNETINKIMEDIEKK